MTALSVNLNKIALLRNSRGRDYPNVCHLGEQAILAGAAGLTIHPRPDQRHAKYSDIAPLKALCDQHHVELNIEGYPSAELLEICLEQQVAQVTLVPDAPDQLTSDHGWIVSEHRDLLHRVLEPFRASQTRISLFMDTDVSEITLAGQLGVARIELHTERYARSAEQQTEAGVIGDFVAAEQAARAAGLAVNAGHDLDLNNLAYFLSHVNTDEVSIGHALTAEALLAGWQKTIENYVKICRSFNTSTRA